MVIAPAGEDLPIGAEGHRSDHIDFFNRLVRLHPLQNIATDPSVRHNEIRSTVETAHVLPDRIA